MGETRGASGRLALFAGLFRWPRLVPSERKLGRTSRPPGGRASGRRATALRPNFVERPTPAQNQHGPSLGLCATGASETIDSARPRGHLSWLARLAIDRPGQIGTGRRKRRAKWRARAQPIRCDSIIVAAERGRVIAGVGRPAKLSQPDARRPDDWSRRGSFTAAVAIIWRRWRSECLFACWRPSLDNAQIGAPGRRIAHASRTFGRRRHCCRSCPCRATWIEVADELARSDQLRFVRRVRGWTRAGARAEST